MNKKQKNKQDLLKIPWTSFYRCEPDSRDPESIIFKNSRYQVHIHRMKAKNDAPDLLHLSFKRLDSGIFIPYRDKMRIKDELIGSEYEAIEIYPARSREVDSANQYHLWIIDDSTYRFPFGFSTRMVTEESVDGSTQEPWPKNERPVDCLTKEDLFEMLKKQGKI
jgi:hypothetical protein